MTLMTFNEASLIVELNKALQQDLATGSDYGDRVALEKFLSNFPRIGKLLVGRLHQAEKIAPSAVDIINKQ